MVAKPATDPNTPGEEESKEKNHILKEVIEKQLVIEITPYRERLAAFVEFIQKEEKKLQSL